MAPTYYYYSMSDVNLTQITSQIHSRYVLTDCVACYMYLCDYNIVFDIVG